MDVSPDIKPTVVDQAYALFAKNATQDDIKKALKLSQPEFLAITNQLLAQDRLDVFSDGAGSHVTKFQVKQKSKLTSMTVQERLVYQAIESAGNKGIWSRDIKKRTNVERKLLTKILKQMEGAKLIKAVNSVLAVKRKMYMLFDLEPHKTLGNSVWYTDQNFDEAYISALYGVSIKRLTDLHVQAKQMHPGQPLAMMRASFASAADILEHVKGLKVSEVELTVEDMETLLDTLVYDGKADKTTGKGQSHHLYKICNAGHETAPSPLLTSPCGVCPVFDKCSDDGVISPSTCQYFQDWLDL